MIHAAVNLRDALSEDLVSACGERPHLVCEWVFDASGGNRTLSRIVEWAVDPALTILVVVAVGFVLTRMARRFLGRLVSKLVAGERAMSQLRSSSLSDEPDVRAVIDDDDAQARLRRSSRATAIGQVLTSTMIIAIWTIAMIMILGELGLNLGPVIAGAGIVGVALGFGAQSLVKDCISGIFMLIEDQYAVGDVVDLGEAVGVVEEVALRTTVLRGVDGTVWHVPNGEIQRVGNKSQHWSVAVVDVDVAYDADLDAVRTLLLDTAAQLCADPEWAPDVLADPEVLGIEALGADAVTMRMTVQTAPGTQWRLQRALREAFKAALDHAEIEIPFPQRTVWLRNQGS